MPLSLSPIASRQTALLLLSLSEWRAYSVSGIRSAHLSAASFDVALSLCLSHT